MLHLKTFGGLSVETDSAPAAGAAQQRKRLALLALLAAAGRRGTSRDKLIAFLWPDSDAEHGRNLLKQACFALRRDLSAPTLFLGTLELRLNPDVIATDIQAFEDALARGDAAQAVARYGGPFLDGFYLGEAGDFERWVEAERAQWTKRVCEALEALATQAAAAGDLRGSVRWWRRLTELDRLSSHAACELMRALVAIGDAAAALEVARLHEHVVRDALGVAPDSAVTELATRLRAAGAAPSPRAFTGPAAPAAEPLPPVSPAQALRRRLALGGAVTAVLVGIVLASSRRPPSLDPELLAVVPFDVLDSNLGPSRDRLVNGLSRDLDGFGPYRTVSPTVVRRRWDGGADRQAAAGLARRVGAGVVLFGRLSRVPPDSLRLRVSALDARRNEVVAEIDRTAAGDLDRMADSLALDVARAPGPSGGGIPSRLLAVGTHSLPALKAFIQGERQFRRYALDSAVASYDRAITLDTTFAVAYRAAARARGWNFQPTPFQAMRAIAYNHGLNARDSLLIVADTGPMPFHESVAHKFTALQEATRRYPEDADVWFELGDHRFHNGFAVWWNTWNDARAAFDRAIALDSTVAAAYIHPTEIALNDDDEEAARRYVRGYLAIPGVHADGAGMRLLSLLLERQRTVRREFDRALQHADLATLRRLAFAIRTWPDSTEAQIRVARRLLAVAEATTPGGSPAGEYNLRQYRSILAEALIFRGHLREAREVVGDRFVMSGFMELAHLGALEPEVVEAAIARWFQYPYHPDYQGDHVAFPWLTEASCYRTMDVAWWWAARRDTVQLRRLVGREDSTARAQTPGVVAWARPVPRFARAALAMARGDTAHAALVSLWMPPDSICDSRPHVEALFQVLVAVGRLPEAATVFDWRHDRWVPWVLARARLAERLGDRATAIHYYQFVCQAWLHADPDLQPVVAEARSAIARLEGGHP